MRERERKRGREMTGNEQWNYIHFDSKFKHNEIQFKIPLQGFFLIFRGRDNTRVGAVKTKKN